MGAMKGNSKHGLDPLFDMYQLEEEEEEDEEMVVPRQMPAAQTFNTLTNSTMLQAGFYAGQFLRPTFPVQRLESHHRPEQTYRGQKNIRSSEVTVGHQCNECHLEPHTQRPQLP